MSGDATRQNYYGSQQTTLENLWENNKWMSRNIFEDTSLIFTELCTKLASSDSESCEWNIVFAERMNIKHLYKELLLVYYNMHWKSFHSFSSIVQLINEY